MNRHNPLFGDSILDYQLTRAKLRRMAVLIQAGWQFSHAVATRMATGDRAMEASIVKINVCKAAERVGREAMQMSTTEHDVRCVAVARCP